MKICRMNRNVHLIHSHTSSPWTGLSDSDSELLHGSRNHWAWGQRVMPACISDLSDWGKSLKLLSTNGFLYQKMRIINSTNMCGGCQNETDNHPCTLWTRNKHKESMTQRWMAIRDSGLKRITGLWISGKAPWRSCHLGRTLPGRISAGRWEEEGKGAEGGRAQGIRKK